MPILCIINKRWFSSALEKLRICISRDLGVPGGSVVKNLPTNAGDKGDTCLIPGSGRSPGGGNGNLLWYSCLGNPKDRGVWQAIVHGVAKSWIWLSTFLLLLQDRVNFSLWNHHVTRITVTTWPVLHFDFSYSLSTFKNVLPPLWFRHWMPSWLNDEWWDLDSLCTGYRLDPDPLVNYWSLQLMFQPCAERSWALLFFLCALSLWSQLYPLILKSIFMCVCSQSTSSVWTWISLAVQLVKNLPAI